MKTETTFTTNNTEGYSAADLAELNAIWVARGGADLDDSDDSDAYKSLCEEILRDYDTANSDRFADA